MIPEGQVYYYKNRVYDPVIGRFLQTDPVGYSSDVNLYAYVANDPINLTDPLGLVSVCGTESFLYYTTDIVYDGGDGAAGDFVITPHKSRVTTCLTTPDTFSGLGGGGGGGGAGGHTQTPQNKQPSPTDNRAAACAALVAKNDLAGSVLDAASIIPGGGDLADVARLGAGAASLGISASQGNKIGTAIGATGTALGGVVVARNTVNAAAVGVKDGLEAVPGIGTVVGLGALAFDAYSAVDDYNKCMSGH